MDKIDLVTQTKGHFQNLVTLSMVFDLAAKFLAKNFGFLEFFNSENGSKGHLRILYFDFSS